MTEQVETKTVDRTGWAPGPWDEEPDDRAEWRHKGFPCLMVRNSMGGWCGYVGLPPGHSLHGKGYDEAHDARNIEVHGGLTYANACAGHICHVPKEGESPDVWWFGFDCGHAWDVTPGMARDYAMPDMTYRSQRYVKQEVESLADQLA